MHNRWRVSQQPDEGGMIRGRWVASTSVARERGGGTATVEVAVALEG
jgi:hypothetical protein